MRWSTGSSAGPTPCRLLVITPDHGPRVRFATVLTDAPLTAGKPRPEGCGSCDACIKACPAGAFTGRSFDPGEERGRRKDSWGVKENGNLCGICVLTCPYGRRRQPADPAPAR
ncbi:MAG TPA: 4Fe-4S double cluster binding domain-containing protein [Bacillota bacterium]